MMVDFETIPLYACSPKPDLPLYRLDQLLRVVANAILEHHLDILDVLDIRG